jgi:uncharacterized membrane protein
MTAGNAFAPLDAARGPGDPELFSALLTPHRSLSRGGFLVLMSIVGGVSCIGGLASWLLGAWPVVGFFGLDAVAIYLAFLINFHRARAYEEISITLSELRLRRVSHRGRAVEWCFNPRWVRLDKVSHQEFGIENLYLVSGGRRVGIASFLSPDEKASFAKALTSALQSAKRGWLHNPG